MVPVVSSENTDKVGLFFDIYPNPLADGSSLQIVLENNYTGTLKFEILGMDGRIFQSFALEKNSPRFEESIYFSGAVTGQVLLVKCIAGKNVFVKRVVKI